MPTIKHTRESIAELEQERNDYKKQRDELSEKLDKECNDNYKLEGQLYDMTKQRDSLIKDVEKLREEKNNLKQSVSDYKNTAEWYVANWQEYKALEHENRTLKSENKALRLQADEYFNLWQDVDSKHKKLTEHIKDKALHNPSVSRYIDLVHFIDELERDTHEG